jgi:Uma2 family endonuclease
MANAMPEPQRWTLEQFLAYDDGTDTRYELHDGVVVAMAPNSVVHGCLVGWLAGRIGAGLSRPCDVAVATGLVPPGRMHTFYLADLVVTCSPLGPDGFVVEPVVIIEVLAPSTAETDILRKLPDYREMPSVQDILLVSSTERRVEHWQREADAWKVRTARGSGEVRLQAVEALLDLGALYDGLVAIEAAA